jgi:putative membrane protein
MNKTIVGVAIVCGLIAFYFSGVGFGFGILGQTVSALLSFGLLYLAGQGGWQRFYLVFLTSFSLAISLGCVFLREGQATGPFVTEFKMAPFVIVLISALISFLVILWNKKSVSKDNFASILLAVFILNWLILAINVEFFDDWVIENLLTIPFILLIYLTHKWFRLSNVSYGLIFAYMMLHIYGSHYTYSEVPFGFWMQDNFDMLRNHYDRIVHFAFGFLLAYPLREMTVRISDAKGFWGFWFPIEFVLAFSCIYEILEWLIAIVFGGDLGVAYLGSQGDIWDAQKDMLLAGLGAVITMSIVAGVLWYYRGRDFWNEFKGSLRVKHKGILGEEALSKLENK